MAADLTGLRLKEEPRRRLETLAKESGKSLADVATTGINILWESREAARAEVERERVRQATELLAELRRRLGDDLHIEDNQGIAFSNSGQIAVEVGDTSYVLTDSGEIVASRATGGRHEMAIVGENGITGWMATAPAEPALN